ncbi:MAG: RNA pseudouridine synthase [Flavobacteriaceae bacterium]|nr:MAG: RNA pseudouridine synthase [Flavobacteriaceae bacterium]
MLDELEPFNFGRFPSTDLYEHYRFEAGPGQSPLRVDKFLMNFIENATRNKIQLAAKENHIFVNEVPVKANYKVKAFDKVSVKLSYPPFENTVEGEDIPLDIVFEDDSVIVLNKPPGLVVHPGHGNYSGTLVNALKFHFDKLPSMDQNRLDRPGLVHRIDKDTSGLLVIAKTENAMDGLAKQFFDHSIERRYMALVWGNIEEESGTITGNLARDLKDRMQMSVFDDPEIGKHAVTHYKVVERFRYVTLVQCKLETGRTHQIRAHFKHIGHPLFNDARYGGDKILKGTTFTKYKQFIENCFKVLPRQALHAQTLGFLHPQTGERLQFEQPLPEDLQEVLMKWRNYTQFAD